MIRGHGLVRMSRRPSSELPDRHVRVSGRRQHRRAARGAVATIRRSMCSGGGAPITPARLGASRGEREERRKARPRHGRAPRGFRPRSPLRSVVDLEAFRNIAHPQEGRRLPRDRIGLEGPGGIRPQRLEPVEFDRHRPVLGLELGERDPPAANLEPAAALEEVRGGRLDAEQRELVEDADRCRLGKAREAALGGRAPAQHVPHVVAREQLVEVVVAPKPATGRPRRASRDEAQRVLHHQCVGRRPTREQPPGAQRHQGRQMGPVILMGESVGLLVQEPPIRIRLLAQPVEQRRALRVGAGAALELRQRIGAQQRRRRAAREQSQHDDSQQGHARRRPARAEPSREAPADRRDREGDAVGGRKQQPERQRKREAPGREGGEADGGAVEREPEEQRDLGREQREPVSLSLAPPENQPERAEDRRQEAEQHRRRDRDPQRSQPAACRREVPLASRRVEVAQVGVVAQHDLALEPRPAHGGDHARR